MCRRRECYPEQIAEEIERIRNEPTNSQNRYLLRWMYYTWVPTCWELAKLKRLEEREQRARERGGEGGERDKEEGEGIGEEVDDEEDKRLGQRQFRYIKGAHRICWQGRNLKGGFGNITESLMSHSHATHTLLLRQKLIVDDEPTVVVDEMLNVVSFTTMRLNWLSTGEGHIIIVDATSSLLASDAENSLQQIGYAARRPVSHLPVLVVEHTTFLKGFEGLKKEVRQVKTEDIKALADKYGAAFWPDCHVAQLGKLKIQPRKPTTTTTTTTTTTMTNEEEKPVNNNLDDMRRDMIRLIRLHREDREFCTLPTWDQLFSFNQMTKLKDDHPEEKEKEKGQNEEVVVVGSPKKKKPQKKGGNGHDNNKKLERQESRCIVT